MPTCMESIQVKGIPSEIYVIIRQKFIVSITTEHHRYFDQVPETLETSRSENSSLLLDRSSRCSQRIRITAASLTQSSAAIWLWPGEADGGLCAWGGGGGGGIHSLSHKLCMKICQTSDHYTPACIYSIYSPFPTGVSVQSTWWGKPQGFAIFELHLYRETIEGETGRDT